MLAPEADGAVIPVLSAWGRRGKIKATAQALNAVAKVRGRFMRPARGLAHGRNRSVAPAGCAGQVVAEPDSFRLANAIEDRAARASAMMGSGLSGGKAASDRRTHLEGGRDNTDGGKHRHYLSRGIRPSSLRAAPRCTQLAQLAS